MLLPKVISRWRDPQGQIQGQTIGQKVMLTWHGPTLKVRADLDSLLNSLSSNTKIMKIGLLVAEIMGSKGWRPRPFWPKMSNFEGPYLGKYQPDRAKIWNLGQNKHLYKFSLKSESVEWQFPILLGELTRNDPRMSLGQIVTKRAYKSCCFELWPLWPSKVGQIKNPGFVSCILIICTYDKNLELIQPLVQE
jgi:hypothetical protein